LGPNGVAADSARRLVQILGAQQVPVSVSGIPGDPTTTSGSVIARFDKSPQPSSTPGGITSAPWYLLAIAGLSKTEAGSLSPLTIPAFADRQICGNVGLQGFYSSYSGPGRLWLYETAAGLWATTDGGG